MANLTAEYLDKQLGKIDKKLDTEFRSVRSEIKTVRSELKKDIEGLEIRLEEKIDNLAAMTTRGLEELSRKLDVRERVEKLERKMDKVSEALNL